MTDKIIKDDGFKCWGLMKPLPADAAERYEAKRRRIDALMEDGMPQLDAPLDREAVIAAVQAYLDEIARGRGIIRDIEVRTVVEAETGTMHVKWVGMTEEGDEILRRAKAAMERDGS